MTMQDRYIIVVKTMLRAGYAHDAEAHRCMSAVFLLIGIVFGTIRSLKIPVVDQILAFTP